MFIELVDALRCPNAHEESWLVASADRMEARHIVSGSLGCPVCSAEFPIRDGVVDFRRDGAGPSAVAQDDEKMDGPERSEGQLPDAMTLAALLDLSTPAGFALLEGRWGARVHELAAMVDTPLVAVDPPDNITGATGVTVIRCDGEIPIANGAARAAAVASRARIDSAVRILRAQGRVVAPSGVQVPGEVRELARDAAVWVGEREAPRSPLVTLHGRRA